MEVFWRFLVCHQFSYHQVNANGKAYPLDCLFQFLPPKCGGIPDFPQGPRWPLPLLPPLLSTHTHTHTYRESILKYFIYGKHLFVINIFSNVMCQLHIKHWRTSTIPPRENGGDVLARGDMIKNTPNIPRKLHGKTIYFTIIDDQLMANNQDMVRMVY